MSASATTTSAGHTAVLAPGPWQPGAELPAGVVAAGFIVTRGLLSRDVLLGAGVASDLVGPGDLAGLAADGDAFLPIETRWVACTETQVTYLDDALMESLRRHPDLSARLLAHAAQQADRQAVHRAISQLPRVELRLLALLWLLAERWGRVGAHGIVVPVSLTHEALGRMVGARRPTVSLALKQLDEDGAVHRRADGSWVLSSGSTARLDAGAAEVAPAPEAVLTEEPAAAAPGGGIELAPPARTVASLPLRGEDLARRVGELVDEHARSRARMRELLARSAAMREDLRRARDRRDRRSG